MTNQDRDHDLKRIADLRAEINVVDRRIVRLLVQRLASTDMIGDIKRRNGIDLRTASREDEVLELIADEVRAQAPQYGVDTDSASSFVSEVFRGLMDEVVRRNSKEGR